MHFAAISRANLGLQVTHSSRRQRIQRLAHIIAAGGIHDVLQALADGLLFRAAAEGYPVIVHISDHPLRIDTKDQLLHAAHQHAQLALTLGNALLRFVGSNLGCFTQLDHPPHGCGQTSHQQDQSTTNAQKRLGARQPTPHNTAVRLLHDHHQRFGAGGAKCQELPIPQRTTPHVLLVLFGGQVAGEYRDTADVGAHQCSAIARPGQDHALVSGHDGFKVAALQREILKVGKRIRVDQAHQKQWATRLARHRAQQRNERQARRCFHRRRAQLDRSQPPSHDQGAQHCTAADISGAQTLQIDANACLRGSRTGKNVAVRISHRNGSQKRQARQRLIQRRLYGRSIRNISAQRWRYCQSIQRHFAGIQRARDLVFNHSGQQDRVRLLFSDGTAKRIASDQRHQDHSDQRGSGAPHQHQCAGPGPTLCGRGVDGSGCMRVGHVQRTTMGPSPCLLAALFNLPSFLMRETNSSTTASH